MKRTAVTANTHALREMLRNSGDTRIQTSGSRNTALRGAVAGTDHNVTRVLAPPLQSLQTQQPRTISDLAPSASCASGAKSSGCIGSSAQLSYLSMKVGYTESRIILGPD